MAKKSEDTRLHLFPVLMRHLDDPPPSAIKEIAQGVSSPEPDDLNILLTFHVPSRFSIGFYLFIEW